MTVYTYSQVAADDDGSGTKRDWYARLGGGDTAPSTSPHSSREQAIGRLVADNAAALGVEIVAAGE